jgi:hypothetical protein
MAGRATSATTGRSTPQTINNQPQSTAGQQYDRAELRNRTHAQECIQAGIDGDGDRELSPILLLRANA